ncbi:hypothetical protein HYV86_07085 [Candidatus Woesearchaeota archaeon]|nr:hypothetical protein [Candidatus Woesearchaeota archaeon]
MNKTKINLLAAAGLAGTLMGLYDLVAVTSVNRSRRYDAILAADRSLPTLDLSFHVTQDPRCDSDKQNNVDSLRAKRSYEVSVGGNFYAIFCIEEILANDEAPWTFTRIGEKLSLGYEARKL